MPGKHLRWDGFFQYKAWQPADTVLQLFFRVDARLLREESARKKGERTLRFRYLLFLGNETYDSGSVLLSYSARHPKPFRLESPVIGFSKKQAMLRMEVFDQATGRIFVHQSRLDLTGSRILLRHLPDSNVWLLPYLTPGAPYALQTAGNRQAYVFNCTETQAPAAPPFDESTEITSCRTDKAKSLSSGDVFQQRTQGIYLFANDTLNAARQPFHIRDRMFPEAGPEGAFNSMIYLLSDGEFSRLKASSTPETSLDSLWAAWLESENRGSRYLNLYHRRFQEANISFTGFKEGWKTDMGMTYLVFGPPDELHYTLHGYHWVYRKGNGNRLTFHFMRRETPYGPEYVLQRQPGYAEAWYEAVEAWRTGKVRY